MRKRNTSGPGKGDRRNSGRGESRSNSSRGNTRFSKSKSFGRSRDEGDERKSKGSRFGDRDDSRPSGGKSFGRSKERSSGVSSRGERSFGKPRDERGDERPRKSSKFSDKRGDSKRNFSKPSRFSGDRDDSNKSFSKSSGEKSFRRSREEGDERKSFGRRDDEREFKSDRSDRREKKSGFFSKLSRGGKSVERKHDRDFGKSVKEFSEHKTEQQEAASDKIRLNKYISNSGVCSRREADQLITMGLVTVNGQTITELGYKINRGDVVKYDGKTLRSEKPVYILLNKPKGYLTTTKDPQERNTVMHIVGDAVKERIYPVGRLDRNTTGLLLLTNDGELTEKLSHPSYNVKKIYKVELDKPLSKADFQKIIDGVVLEEGRAMVDDLAIVSEDGKTVGIELHIGWNRVVRRIFERLDYQVLKLDRTIYAGLDKKELPRGQWRFLTKEEVVRLKHYQ